MHWFIKCLRLYGTDKGRARRSEYWYFVLFNLLFGSVIGGIDALLGNDGFITLGTLYALALFIPGIAVAIRRLHDVGKSGWMLLLYFLPIIGWIWLLVLMVTDSEPGENKYGPNPKGFETI